MQFWNPDTKTFFYYNSKTEETTYEKPCHIDGDKLAEKYDIRRQGEEMTLMVTEDQNVLKIKKPKEKKGYGKY